MKKISLILIVMINISHLCSGQVSNDFFARKEIVAQWKHSMYDAISQFSNDSGAMIHNYRYALSHIDTSIVNMVNEFKDSCNDCKLENKYIMFNIYSGEINAYTLYLRSFNKKSKGCEMTFYNGVRKAEYSFRHYIQDKKELEHLFNEAGAVDYLSTNILAISLYKEGKFQTHIINIEARNTFRVMDFIEK